MRDKIRDTLEQEFGFQEDEDLKDTAHALQANLKVNKRDGDTGVLKETQHIKNIITNDGADMVRNAIGGNGNPDQTIQAYRWTAVGSNRATGVGSADSQLNSEIARSQNQFNTAPNGNWGQFSNVTTFTNIANTVRESGLFNTTGANNGTMLAHQTFGDISMTTDDSLEVIWKVYFSEV